MSLPSISEMEKTPAPLDAREVFRLGTDFSPRSGHWGSALPFIYGLAAGCRARRMLEIGVWHGGSTRALLNAAALNDGHLTSIDIDECAAAAPEALRRCWTFLRGDSRVVLPTLRDEIDFALVDGEHTFDAVSRELMEIRDEVAGELAVILWNHGELG